VREGWKNSMSETRMEREKIERNKVRGRSYIESIRVVLALRVESE